MTSLELIAIGVQPTQAKAFAPHIDPAFRRFGIFSFEQRCGFLAQAMHESRGFTRLEEDLYYTTVKRARQMWPDRLPTLAAAEDVLRKPRKLANTVYSNRLGNGNYATDDGWRFRGRGLFQLTFRGNYAAASADIGRDYVAHPELVAEPEDAVLTAAWFWSTSGCNALIARGVFDATTRKINPAMAGAAERRGLFKVVRTALLEVPANVA